MVASVRAWPAANPPAPFAHRDGVLDVLLHSSSVSMKDVKSLRESRR